MQVLHKVGGAHARERLRGDSRRSSGHERAQGQHGRSGAAAVMSHSSRRQVPHRRACARSRREAPFRNCTEGCRGASGARNAQWLTWHGGLTHGRPVLGDCLQCKWSDERICPSRLTPDSRVIVGRPGKRNDRSVPGQCVGRGLTLRRCSTAARAAGEEQAEPLRVARARPQAQCLLPLHVA